MRPPTNLLACARVVKYLRSAAALFGVFALLMRATAVFAANPAPVQLFYVPFPKTNCCKVQAINSADPVDPVTDYLSIAAVANGTIIYYDQWENGYDTDIANPTDLYSSPEISTHADLGDGNVANGFLPGHPERPDPRRHGHRTEQQHHLDEPLGDRLRRPRQDRGDEVRRGDQDRMGVGLEHAARGFRRGIRYGPLGYRLPRTGRRQHRRRDRPSDVRVHEPAILAGEGGDRPDRRRRERHVRDDRQPARAEPS